MNLRRFSLNGLALLTVCFCLFSFGLHLSLTGGYGSDNDAYGLLSSFLSIYLDGDYAPSRFTGYPLAELIVGFLALKGGYKLSSSISYIAYISSLPLIYYGFRYHFSASRKAHTFLWFFIFCCLNGTLFFDNVQTMDYSWALFFLGLGIFLDSFGGENIFSSLSLLCLSCSIGCRPNFAIFALLVVFFGSNFSQKLNKRRLVTSCLSSLIVLFVASLFYWPIWFDHSFGLEWITVAKEPFVFTKVISRFLYKALYSVGFLVCFFILFWVTLKLSKMKVDQLQISRLKKIFRENRLPLVLSFSNLMLFLWAPIDYSYLQVFLVVTFYFSAMYGECVFKILISLLLFFEWFVVFTPIDYKSSSQFFLWRFNSDCSGGPRGEGVIDQDRKLTIQPGPGRYLQYRASRFIGGNCWGKDVVEKLNDLSR